MNLNQTNTRGVKKPKKSYSVVFWKRIINLSMIILGILFVFSFVGYMQKRYSEMKNAKTSANALSSIIDTMDDNTEKVRLLTERYHFDNNSILEDIATLLGRGSYSGLYAETPEERCHAMEKLSNAVGGDGYIFVIDKDGNVVLTPSMNFIGINLKTIGSFSEDAYKVLTGPRSVSSFAVVSARPVGTDSDAYFYGKSLSDGYCLVYGVDSRILEEQYAALKNLGPILSSAVVGETGFIFAVDSSTREFLYFNDGNHDLSGKTSHEYGLSDEALSNGYEGEQTINGVSYHCISRTYSSELYGKYTVICAVCSTEEVFATNRVTVFVTSGTFFICTLLLFVYATLMHMDPDELADYDERILPASKAKYLHREPEKRKQIHNIQCLKLKHDVVFFKVSVAEKLAPIAAIGLILVFVVSWNAQTLVELSKGMTESAVALSQVERLFGSGETSSGILMDRYQNQYLSKIKLLSYILEEDPELVFGSAAAESGSDAVHTYLDEDYEPILDGNGYPITSIAYSSALNELAAHNSIDTLF
ncbi:MAG: hypothetical protein MJ175_13320, partial [Clostridia bacterium]|nr:hypothetical protein [Clostridia bacterium]